MFLQSAGLFINRMILPGVILILMESLWVIPYTAPPGFCSEQQGRSRMITISAIENEQTHAVAKEVLTEAYHRLGYQVKFDDLPGRRALEWANNGKTGGDAARIKGTEKKFSNLICINVPVIYFKGVAFSKIIEKDIRCWDDLKGLRVGVIRGIRYSTIGTQGMAPFFAKDMTHLFSLLDKGRIEVAVAVLDAGRVEINKNFKHSGIHVLGSPLFSEPLYHFINQKHQDLAEPLEKVLMEMTASGRIKELQKNALEKLIKN